MEEEFLFETLVKFYRTRRRYIFIVTVIRTSEPKRYTNSKGNVILDFV
jgi:hypothetical protein